MNGGLIKGFYENELLETNAEVYLVETISKRNDMRDLSSNLDIPVIKIVGFSLKFPQRPNYSTQDILVETIVVGQQKTQIGISNVSQSLYCFTIYLVKIYSYLFTKVDVSQELNSKLVVIATTVIVYGHLQQLKRYHKYKYSKTKKFKLYGV